MPANAMEELKDLDKELENADVQSGNTTSDHQEQSSDEDAPAPVQEGKVNDNDASELLEDPQADASSDKGLVATRQEELLAQANKPFEKPPLELPIREGVVEDTKQQLKAESNKPFEKPPVKIPVRKGQVPDTIEFFENLAAGNKRSAKSSKQASGTGQSELASRREAYLAAANKPFEKPQAPAPGRSELAARREAYLAAANKPFEKPQTPAPGRSELAARREAYLAAANKPFEKPQTPAPGRSELAARREAYLAAANKPFEKPQTPAPGRSELAARREAYLAAANKPFEKPELQLDIPKGIVEARKRELFSNTATTDEPLPPTPAQSDTGRPSKPLPPIPTKSDTGRPGKPLPPIPAQSDAGRPSKPLQPIPTKSDTGRPSKPLPPTPAQSDTGRRSKPLPPIPAKSDTGEPGKPLPPTPDKPTSSESEQQSDSYAMLKKDPNTLSEAEKQERARLLQQKYVEDWKKKKEKEEEELSKGDKKDTDNEEAKEATGKPAGTSESAASESPASESSKSSWKDKLKWGKDKLLSGLDTLMEKGGPKVEEFVDTKKKEGTEQALNTANLAEGGWGMFSNTYSLFKAHRKHKQKRKQGDSIGAGLERFNMFSNLFGATSGGTTTARGVTGFMGGNEKVSRWLDAATGIADLGKNATDMFRGMYQSRAYANLANRKETESSKAKMAHDYMKSRETYKQMKDAYNKNEEGARSKEKRMEMLKEKRAYQRSKDFIEAMEAAQETARNKSKAGKWDTASGALKSFGAAFGLADTLAGEKLKNSGTLGKVASFGISALGKLMNFGAQKVEKMAEGKTKEAQKQSNAARGKKYLDEKVATFLKKLEPQADHVTEEEARFIMAQRLGVEDPNNHEAIYKKLAERRAERILKKEEGYEDVLAAMGLNANADKASILEALGVSGD